MPYVYLEWGSDNPFLWEVDVANSWRTTQGSPLNWQKILYDIDAVNFLYILYTYI
jgi:hypothetical protein